MPKEMVAWKLFLTTPRCIDDVTEKREEEWVQIRGFCEKRET